MGTTGHPGDATSGVVILEAAVRQFEESLGLRHAGISALSRRADDLLSTLSPDERQQVRSNNRFSALLSLWQPSSLQSALSVHHLPVQFSRLQCKSVSFFLQSSSLHFVSPSHSNSLQSAAVQGRNIQPHPFQFTPVHFVSPSPFGLLQSTPSVDFLL